MAIILKDRVKVTSNSVGVGDFLLGSAVTGYRTFASVMSDGESTLYTIANDPAGEWEVGIGVYNGPANSITRQTILDSSDSGSIVNFVAGEKIVFITYPAAKAATRDEVTAYTIAFGG